ncbi:MBL fold metallo-hydrolase [Candidatus Woesearchaeota archaeon]|nr:MBL fold metallo-hydrolase [Candidatus Woesearchaeota archaeon]
MIKIHTLGGYDEVGRNMTAVEVEDEIIILDMGLHLDSYIKIQDSNQIQHVTKETLLKSGAIPDDNNLDKSKVVAIIPSHAHLDHFGAIPYMEAAYDAPILSTPFAKEVLTKIANDQNIKLKNKIKTLEENKQYKTKHTTIELISVTHSVIETVIVAITTKQGTIIYANDFKIDVTPTFGSKTDMEQLKKFNIIALICDCIKADLDEETPSESVAKNMLEELFETQDFANKAIIISTFSSHIARLQSILHCAKKIGRKTLFVGRSLAKYVEAAACAEDINFFADVEMLKYGDQIKKSLKHIAEKRTEYVIVATGHQGEPNAVLTKLAANKLPFKLFPNDVVIFSSTVIPNEENIKNRSQLEEQLEQKGITVFKDIHVSGHAARKDLKAFISILKPKHIIPAHGPRAMQKNLISIGKELGYSDEFLHYSENGTVHEII